ncbi:uncharacterized protein PV09_07730 [Verruconis gallopava]|uniref:Uncharacterized protein n=1 Tax=Verruconis gallopava TaxID=253628 RepID=A0A0D1YIP9_9PEZI|nr:uncharacterized protein PV09_07730 [Verruconis gallopava]KIW00747.1 hypothetical protein PV09_07730 [Verruconis gallopava]
MASRHEHRHQPAPYGTATTSGPNYKWWIPAAGIRRDVIQADIQRYLGDDALVRPGEGREENEGQPGYWIAASRPPTEDMIRDLKADSANYERSGDTGRYEDSMVHRSRQYWGPTNSSPYSEPPRNTSYSEPPRRTGAPAPNLQTYQGQYAHPPSYPAHPPVLRSPYAQEEMRRYANTEDSGSGYTYGSVRQASEFAQDQFNSQPRQFSTGNYPEHPPQYAHNYPRSHNQREYQAAAPRAEPHSSSRMTASTTNAAQSSPTTGSAQGPAHPLAVTNPRPGYYLASDGNYYPDSTRQNI